MTTIIANAETLINGYAEPMSRELAINAIAQFGDWDTFLETHEDVCTHGVSGGFSGWIMTHELVNFYADNKADILAFATETASDMIDDTLSNFVAGFHYLAGQYSEGEIAEALHDTENEHYSGIAEAMAWFVAEALSHSCQRMMEDAKESAAE